MSMMHIRMSSLPVQCPASHLSDSCCKSSDRCGALMHTGTWSSAPARLMLHDKVNLCINAPHLLFELPRTPEQWLWNFKEQASRTSDKLCLDSAHGQLGGQLHRRIKHPTRKTLHNGCVNVPSCLPYLSFAGRVLQKSRTCATLNF